MLGRFNGFVKCVILRVSEARDLGDVDRYAFYDHMKVYTAAPPDVLRVDEKNIREYSRVQRLRRDHHDQPQADGIYLPADDRRHYVAWSRPDARTTSTTDYWTSLYGWFAHGGNAHVAAYLATLDLTGFDPKAPPPKTAASGTSSRRQERPEDAAHGRCAGQPQTTRRADHLHAGRCHQ